MDINKCPAREKSCLNCKRKDYFQSVCRYRKIIKGVKKTKPFTENIEVYSKKKHAKSRETVKLNVIKFPMQVDTGRDVTLVPRNFWEKMGKPKLRKCNLNLKQFDGSVIKTLGSFEVIFEIKTRYKIIPITVVQCTKNHGLLEIDVFKVDTAKLIN